MVVWIRVCFCGGGIVAGCWVTVTPLVGCIWCSWNGCWIGCGLRKDLFCTGWAVSAAVVNEKYCLASR